MKPVRRFESKFCVLRHGEHQFKSCV